MQHELVVLRLVLCLLCHVRSLSILVRGGGGGGNDAVRLHKVRVLFGEQKLGALDQIRVLNARKLRIRSHHRKEGNGRHIHKPPGHHQKDIVQNLQRRNWENPAIAHSRNGHQYKVNGPNEPTGNGKGAIVLHQIIHNRVECIVQFQRVRRDQMPITSHHINRAKEEHHESDPPRTNADRPETFDKR